jgi:hypothetical protein
VILGIGHVKKVTIERHALWTVETCGGSLAVDSRRLACADSFNQSSLERGDDNAIVTGIGDEKAIGLLISQNLPRKSERQVTDAGAFQRQTQGCSFNSPRARNSAASLLIA